RGKLRPSDQPRRHLPRQVLEQLRAEEHGREPGEGPEHALADAVAAAGGLGRLVAVERVLAERAEVRLAVRLCARQAARAAILDLEDQEPPPPAERVEEVAEARAAAGRGRALEVRLERVPAQRGEILVERRALQLAQPELHPRARDRLIVRVLDHLAHEALE